MSNFCEIIVNSDQGSGGYAIERYIFYLELWQYSYSAEWHH